MFAVLRRISLTKWIIFSMVAGIALGQFAPDFAKELGPISNVFLRMIKSLIAPLLFSTLVIGIAGHGDDLKQVGKLAFRSIVYFEVVTTLALVVGLVAVNLVRPGEGVAAAAATGAVPPVADKITWGGLLEHIVLAHHGSLEFGSPRLPAIPEAFFLHHLDNLDAKVWMTTHQIATDPDPASAFTAYNKQLETRLFKHSGKLEN